MRGSFYNGFGDGQTKIGQKAVITLDENNSLSNTFQVFTDLEAIRLFFVVNHSLSNKQKKTLSDLGGHLASIFFHNDVESAMKFIKENVALLDTFNSLWFTNFR